LIRLNLKVRNGNFFKTHANQYKDWIIGPFVGDPDFNSEHFEFKFQKGKKGEARPPKSAPDPNTKTLPILIYGEIRIAFHNGTDNVYLREEGDYVLFEPNEPHEFEFLEDTLIITLRWKE
jgi:quercetin dioxygenase-like cupin family protein